ncbi:MAG: hypothetical protein QOJ50_412 [Cryptosporangiaceae bacterium]|nr:hypothetical protein [Cryptosporangiaceae bacterium]
MADKENIRFTAVREQIDGAREGSIRDLRDGLLGTLATRGQW